MTHVQENVVSDDRFYLTYEECKFVNHMAAGITLVGFLFNL